jgi:hypothetical protein
MSGGRPGPCHGRADHVREALAEPEDVPQRRHEVLGVAAVVEDDPVVRVEDRQPVGDALGGGEEAGLARREPRVGLLAGGDVGREQHAAAARPSGPRAP